MLQYVIYNIILHKQADTCGTLPSSECLSISIFKCWAAQLGDTGSLEHSWMSKFLAGVSFYEFYKLVSIPGGVHVTIYVIICQQ